MNADDIAKVNAEVIRKRLKRCQQKRAENAEAIIGNRLRSFGFVEVHRVETGRDIRGKSVRKVAGDWTGLSPTDGRGMLCEVKSHKGEADSTGDLRLHWSDLRPHQPLRLDGYEKAGAWAFLAWVGPHGIAIMSWRRLRSLGFAPRHSIGAAEVAAASLAPGIRLLHPR